MFADQLEAALFFTAVCVLLALGLWYLGIRRGSLRAKQFAVMIGIAPVLIFAIEVAGDWYSRNQTREYRTSAVIGSWNRRDHNAPVKDETKYHVINAGANLEVQLTPKAWGGDQPSQPVRLRFSVLSPKGEILTQGEQQAVPAKGLRWSMVQTPRFQARGEGEHTIVLEVPYPVGTVDILVREFQ